MADHVQVQPATTEHAERVITVGQVITDATRRVVATGVRFATLDIVLGILAALGVLALIINAATEGFDDLEPWGYTAIVAGFLLSSVMSAPLVAILLWLTRADWRRPISRIAEIQAAAGIVVLILYIPLFIVVPEAEGRFTIWVDWPWGAPAFFDLILLLMLVFSAYAFLYLSAMPDFAVVRDKVAGDPVKHRRYSSLARGWRGSLRQWTVLRPGLGVLGGLYMALYIFVVTIFFWDFALALLPSWRSAVFPAFAVMSGLETGLASVIVMMYALRRWGGMEEYLPWTYFWAISKLLLTAALLWFYLWFSELMIFWYGRLPGQINVLDVVMFGVYGVPMLLAVILNFVAPLVILMWNKVRKTVAGPTLVACLILVGTFIDRLRIFGAGFASTDPFAHELTEELIPEFLVPSVWDVLIVIGALAGALLCIRLAMRIVPMPSIWEVGGGVGLRIQRRYLNHSVTVVAKPD